MTAEQVTFEDFSESPNRARDPARVDALADEIEAILTDPTRCTWCGTQVRQYDRDHDEAEAVHLSVGDTKGAFYAAGHRLAEDGTVDAHYRLRLTRHATRGRLRDGDHVFCGTCGRVPSDPVEGAARPSGSSRPSPTFSRTSSTTSIPTRSPPPSTRRTTRTPTTITPSRRRSSRLPPYPRNRTAECIGASFFRVAAHT
ncbi:hypothetical protein ACFQL0_21970 [Haloplanus litoreus]|uniref:hypothetical protein n=1 Tax=Haloplanus litoreus TaxID=767515 RepID=UPI00361E6475